MKTRLSLLHLAAALVLAAIIAISGAHPTAAAAPTVVDQNLVVASYNAKSVPAPGVLSGATDPNQQILIAELVMPPQHGDLYLDGSGGFDYTPHLGYVGPDSFTFQAKSGFDTSNVGTVWITVENAPVATNDSYQLNADGTIVVDAAAGLLANDSDPEGDPIFVDWWQQPLWGTLTVQPDGSFTYAPYPGSVGGFTTTYTISDGIGQSWPASITFTLPPVGPPPDVQDDAYSTPQDTPLAVPAPGVLANDSFANNNSAPVALVPGADVTNGSLALSIDGSFIYTPDSEFSGTDSFQYYINNIVIASPPVTVTITVEKGNTPPVAQDDTYSTPQDTLLVIPAPGLLANDSDPDGDHLEASLRTVLLPVGTFLKVEADGSFMYQPPPEASGTAYFKYAVWDGHESVDATLTIEVQKASTSDPSSTPTAPPDDPGTPGTPGEPTPTPSPDDPGDSGDQGQPDDPGGPSGDGNGLPDGEDGSADEGAGGPDAVVPINKLPGTGAGPERRHEAAKHLPLWTLLGFVGAAGLAGGTLHARRGRSSRD